MASRMIRDDVITSERYCSVSIRARLFYLHLLLNLDDYGCCTASAFTLRAMCFPSDIKFKPNILQKLLAELVKADLVRPYKADSQEYIYVPRFKQKLRKSSRKYPAPPTDILEENLKNGNLPPHQNPEFEKLGTKGYEADFTPSKNPEKSKIAPFVLQHEYSTKPPEEKRREEKSTYAPPELSAPKVNGHELPTPAQKPKSKKQQSDKFPIPENFTISDRVKVWAQKKGYGQLDRYFEFFVSKSKAKRYLNADWDEAFMGCIREDWPDYRKDGGGNESSSVFGTF